jgi:hypothetical protein
MRINWQTDLAGAPHPNSPAGRFYDWSSLGVPHPASPAGRNFDWSLFGVPHPLSPAGPHCNWSLPQTESLAVDSSIEALDLAPVAKKAAYDLKKLYPHVVFTSGRRSLEDQARAMASNIATDPPNRKWIEQTYHKSAVSKACQKWVDDNPSKTTQKDIAAGLMSVFDSMTAAQVSQISKHLSGEAFDVQPVTKDASKIKKTLRQLTKDGGKFLEKEGGRTRWHAQF